MRVSVILRLPKSGVHTSINDGSTRTSGLNRSIEPYPRPSISSFLSPLRRLALGYDVTASLQAEGIILVRWVRWKSHQPYSMSRKLIPAWTALDCLPVVPQSSPDNALQCVLAVLYLIVVFFSSVLLRVEFDVSAYALQLILFCGIPLLATWTMLDMACGAYCLLKLGLFFFIYESPTYKRG